MVAMIRTFTDKVTKPESPPQRPLSTSLLRVLIGLTLGLTSRWLSCCWLQPLKPCVRILKKIGMLMVRFGTNVNIGTLTIFKIYVRLARMRPNANLLQKRTIPHSCAAVGGLDQDLHS